MDEVSVLVGDQGVDVAQLVHQLARTENGQGSLQGPDLKLQVLVVLGRVQGSQQPGQQPAGHGFKLGPGKINRYEYSFLAHPLTLYGFHSSTKRGQIKIKFELKKYPCSDVHMTQRGDLAV